MTPQSGNGESWREGHDILKARMLALPELLRAHYVRGPRLDAWEKLGPSSVITTGVGSSAAHARYLAHLLASRGAAARFAPLSAFVDGPPSTSFRPDESVLVVFSQGLASNAQLALRHHRAFRRVVLITAVAKKPGPRLERLERLRAEGVFVSTMPGEDEYSVLIRVTGPMAGYLEALQWSQILGEQAPSPLGSIDRACDRLLAIRSAPDAALPRGSDALDAAALEANLGFLALGEYGELVDNLRYKVLEGMFLPLPPAWDLLAFAHGPFQQMHPHETTLVALSRSDAPSEPLLLDRARKMLDPRRHRLVALQSTLAGPLAILEHEALLNELVLHYIAERGIDQVRWPGKGHDGALYDLSDWPTTPAASLAAAPTVPARPIHRMTWMEIEALLKSGSRTAVVPLGATEQHGPHLAMITDTLIADAVAERVCTRLEGAVALPALWVGCSSEHLDFAGTLSLSEDTLAAVVGDLLASLARHGFERALVFSAHGGNAEPLQNTLARILAAAPSMQVVVHTQIGDVFEKLQHESASCGIPESAAGHHAGEIETSILAALHPSAVRFDRLTPGKTELDPELAVRDLFYPSLRRHAPNGTVGDPRPWNAERADRYLDLWADQLARFATERFSALSKGRI